MGHFGFMMHVLDEENTVSSVVQTNVIGREDCYDRLREIGKILRSGKRITIAGRDGLDSPRVKSTTVYEFPGLGKFYGNSRVHQFASIWNEHGQCYDAQMGDEKPCPSNGFPITERVAK